MKRGETEDPVYREAVEEALLGKYAAERSQDLKFAYNRGAGTYEDAEDARQDAYLNAWQHLEDFEGEPKKVRNWLYQILENRSKDFARTRSRRRAILGEEVLWEAEDGGLESAVEHVGIEGQVQMDEVIILRLALGDAIEDLPKRPKDAVCLEYLGFRNPEIAGQMGTTEPAVKQLKFRGHTTIRENHPDLGEF